MLDETLKKIIDNAIETYNHIGVVHITVWLHHLPNQTDIDFLDKYSSSIQFGETKLKLVRLSLAPNAIRNYVCDEEMIAYSTTFAGIPRYLQIPYRAINKVILHEENIFTDLPIIIDKVEETKPKANFLRVVK